MVPRRFIISPTIKRINLSPTGFSLYFSLSLSFFLTVSVHLCLCFSPSLSYSTDRGWRLTIWVTEYTPVAIVTNAECVVKVLKMYDTRISITRMENTPEQCGNNDSLWSLWKSIPTNRRDAIWVNSISDSLKRRNFKSCAKQSSKVISGPEIRNLILLWCEKNKEHEWSSTWNDTKRTMIIVQ